MADSDVPGAAALTLRFDEVVRLILRVAKAASGCERPLRHIVVNLGSALLSISPEFNGRLSAMVTEGDEVLFWVIFPSAVDCTGPIELHHWCDGEWIAALVAASKPRPLEALVLEK